MLSLVLSIYAALVATFALLFNYFKEPVPLMHVIRNDVSAEYGKPYWSLYFRNLGAGSARHVKVRTRQGKARWTPWTSLAPVLDAKSEVGHRVPLTGEEYAALASEPARSSWRVQFRWTQGPVSFVGQRRLTVRPDHYWTREQSDAWG